MGDDEHDDEHEAHIPEGFRVLMPMMPTREQVEQHHMAMQASQHDLYRLFQELPQEQLQAVSRLLHVITCNGASIAEYFEGVATGVLGAKYNICMACGVDHDKEIHTMVEMTGGEDGGNDA